MPDPFLPPLDMERDGRQDTFLVLPVSIDRSPYYRAQIPVVRFRNGAGPSLIMMAGNHGDEYEGQFALRELLARLTPEMITGTLTVIPSLNNSAVAASRRCSALDEGNLNRSFPGRPDGGYTERLAHALEAGLFREHAYVYDLHAGGTTMAHLPCALCDPLDESDPRWAKTRELMFAQGLPYAFVGTAGPDSNGALGGVRRAGAIGICAELGGGASVTPEGMRYTRIAIDRILMATGILAAPVLEPGADEPAPCLELEVNDPQKHWVFAPRAGWVETLVEIGEPVTLGQPVARLFDLTGALSAPLVLEATESGIVLSRRLHCVCEPGDSLLQIGRVLAEH